MGFLISFKNFRFRFSLNLFAKRDFALASLAPNTKGDGVVACPGKSVLAVVRGGGSSPSFSEAPNSLWSVNRSLLVAGNSLKRKMMLFSSFCISAKLMIVWIYFNPIQLVFFVVKVHFRFLSSCISLFRKCHPYFAR